MRARDVAVVIPARNEGSTLEAAVRSALAQEVPSGLEVCVAVAPSDDDTRAVADYLKTVDSRVNVVDNPGGVTSVGLNMAIRGSSAPVVVRVDGHAVLPVGYVARAIATLERTGAVNVGGIQNPRGTTPFEVAVGRAMASRFGAGDARFHYGGPEGAVDTVYLGVFQREAIEEVGLFNETLIRNQDYELNYRLRRAGGTIWFDPELLVGYRPRGSIKSLAKQFGQYGWWKQIVLSKHPRSLRWRHLVAPTTTSAVFIGLAVGIFWAPLLVFPVGYGAAVMVGSVAVGRTMLEMLRLLVIYPTMHFSWGAGFLSGLLLRAAGSRDSGNEPQLAS